MPAASSKTVPQTTPSEGSDALKQFVGVVEKKIRNLEKRKTKLDGYREMVQSGKVLNKDQEEAVSHFEKVGASLEFAKELSKQFTQIINEAKKEQKREAKREKQQRHEQDLGRIADVLLLQNVLFHMGQDHVRNDFLEGTNGALHLEEQELTHLDEFFKYVSPSREGQSEEEEEEELSEEDKNFDKKLEKATGHLNSYLNQDEKEVCETTYKEIFHLVKKIHNCGYLDKIPAPPPEEVVVEAPVETVPESAPVATGYDQQVEEEEEEEYEENFQEAPQEFSEAITEAPSESFFSGGTETIQQHQPAQTEATQMQSTISPEPQPVHHQVNDMVAPSRVLDLPQAPEPIEMPPPKQTHDVNEVLAPVLGSYNFVQDSMLDYDSPHMDPAVVAVSQSFIPSATFTNSAQSTSSSNEMSQPDHSLQDTLPSHQTTLGAPSQLPTTDQSYQQQSRYEPSQPSYETSQQSYASQSLADQTPYPTQTLDASSSTYGGQPDSVSVDFGTSSQTVDYSSSSQTVVYSSSSQTVDYGSSSQTSSTTSKLKDLPEFPSAPVETQQDQTVLQSSMLNQQTLSHTSQYGSTGLNSTDNYSSSLGSSQLGSESVSSGLTSQLPSGSSSSPLTITDPSQATIPLPGEQKTDTQASRPAPPKSTMNASAPPFQMTNSMRSSPQMPTMQSSPPGQPQDLTGYQTTLDQPQDYSSSGPSASTGDVGRTQSPSQDKIDQSGVQSADSQGNSYSSYQPYYNKNGGRGKPRGANTNFRGGRGGPAPFIRGGPRYNAPAPRGPNTYNTYVPRDSFGSRNNAGGGPDISYNPNARYGGFNQVQDQSYYSRRGGMPRGGPRGGGTFYR